jgi:hypothetical protein
MEAVICSVPGMRTQWLGLLGGAMVEEEIRLYASHHQFYVQDSEPSGSSDDSTFWTKEACKNRLAIGDGLIGIGTGTYDFVKVRVEQHDAEPPVDLDQWDHVTESGLQIRTKFVLIMGCLSQSGLFFQVKPGHYRVRACHANLAESEQEVPNDWKGGFQDWYLIQFWPSKPLRAKILKRR